MSTAAAGWLGRGARSTQPASAVSRRGVVAPAVPSESRRGDALLLIAAILCADNIGRLHELSLSLDRIPMAKLLLPMGALALVLSQDPMGRLKALRTPPALAFGAYVAAMALSVPTSLVGFDSLNFLVHFLYSAVPLVILLSCAPRTTRDLEVLLRAMTIAVVVFGGMLLLKKATGGGGSRVSSSSTYDPNDVALFAVVCLPAAALVLRSASRMWRWIAVAGMAMAIVIVLLSASRGGMIAMGVVILAMVLVYRRGLPRRWKLAIFPLLAISLLFAPKVFWDRFDSLSSVSNDYNFTSETGRIEIWKRGFNTFLRRPITGSGVDQFQTADGLAPERVNDYDRRWAAAHNVVVQVGVELGLAGLIPFVLIFVTTRTATRRARTLAAGGQVDPRLADIGTAIELAMLGFWVSAMFLSVGYGPVMLTLTALGIAFAHVLAVTSLTPIPTAPSSRRGDPLRMETPHGDASSRVASPMRAGTAQRGRPTTSRTPLWPRPHS